MGIMQARLPEDATGGPYHARRVANLLLDKASEHEVWGITHLVLQKLLYFAHSNFLLESQRLEESQRPEEPKGLVLGHFEAWRYGPVHRDVYDAFRSMGAEEITSRALGEDALTGTKVSFPPVDDVRVLDAVVETLLWYKRVLSSSPGRLVEIAHAKGSPWDVVWQQSRTGIAFGMIMPNDLITRRLRQHYITPMRLRPKGVPAEEVDPG